MENIPQWLIYATGGIVPLMAFIGFWMNLSSRIAKAEYGAGIALEDSRAAVARAAILAKELADYQEKVARDYVHYEVMKDIKNTLTQAIDRLGDRLDRLLSRQPPKDS
jgi:hypothetical protein